MVYRVQNDWKPVPLKYESHCERCGAGLPLGTKALWSPSLKKVRCLEHPAKGTKASVTKASKIDRGLPGASVRAEYERKKSSYEKRVNEMFPRLGNFLLLFLEVPQTLRTWKRGARGEFAIGKRLERLSFKYGFIVLHDRRMPRSNANIDHIAVTPSGVFVIDSKSYSGLIRIERPDGYFSEESPTLFVGRRNCTDLITRMQWQISAVDKVLAKSDEAMPTTGVLAFFRPNWPIVRVPESIHGILINSHGVKQIVAKPGEFTNDQITSTAKLLAEAFPSYLSSPKSRQR
jgi:hypothetical protein